MLGFVWSPVNLFPLHGGEKGFCNSVIMWAAGFGEGLDNLVHVQKPAKGL